MKRVVFTKDFSVDEQVLEQPAEVCDLIAGREYLLLQILIVDAVAVSCGHPLLAHGPDLGGVAVLLFKY